VYGDALVSGDARVYGDALVSGDAGVYGNAWVYGDARVSGNALVSGDARVYGDALVYGNARVYGNALIFWASKVGSENGTLTVYNTVGDGLEVTRGCFIGSVDEFLKASEAKHDEDTHIEYRLLIEVAHSRITRARKLTK
jgi:UDP-3-O-[3-hydroxymyristoyl] glucosamine N-acyltransferase